MWDCISITRAFECFATFSNSHPSNRLHINKLCPNNAIILHKIQFLKLVGGIQQYEPVRVKWASIIISHVSVMSHVWLISKDNWYDRLQLDSRRRQDYETYRPALRSWGPPTLPFSGDRNLFLWVKIGRCLELTSGLPTVPSLRMIRSFTPLPLPICLHAKP